MRALVAATLLLCAGCAPGPGIDLEVRYTGISIADMHVRITSPDFDPVRWYFTVPADDDTGTMDFIEGDVLLRESIEFEGAEDNVPGWDVFAWIDLQSDEEFICATEPLNAVECAPDLQDPQERFDFTVLVDGPTAVNVVIED